LFPEIGNRIIAFTVTEHNPAQYTQLTPLKACKQEAVPRRGYSFTLSMEMLFPNADFVGNAQ
jgi:hypothetical protein